MACKTGDLDAYLSSAAKIPLLTPAEEIELSRLVQAYYLPLRDIYGPLSKQEKRALIRGKRAYDRMITANLRLVVHVASKIQTNQRGSMEMPDIIQEGNIGLHRAVEKFDPSLGYKLSTYAYWWIRQAIYRGIDLQDRTIRIPGHQALNLSAIQKFKTEYLAKHGRQPSLQEAVDYCNQRYKSSKTNPERLAQVLAMAGDAASLDAPIKSTEDVTRLLDQVADEHASPQDDLEQDLQIDLLHQALAHLPARDRHVMVAYNGLDGKEPRTLLQVAKEIGCSRERVRQIHDKAIRRMRRYVIGRPVESITPMDWDEPVQTELFPLIPQPAGAAA